MNMHGDVNDDTDINFDEDVDVEVNVDVHIDVNVNITELRSRLLHPPPFIRKTFIKNQTLDLKIAKIS